MILLTPRRGKRIEAGKLSFPLRSILAAGCPHIFDVAYTAVGDGIGLNIINNALDGVKRVFALIFRSDYVDGT